MSECGRDLYWLHDAWLSRQVHAVYEPTTGFTAVVPRGHDIRKGDPRLAKVHSGIAKHRASLAPKEVVNRESLFGLWSSAFGFWSWVIGPCYDTSIKTQRPKAKDRFTIHD